MELTIEIILLIITISLLFLIHFGKIKLRNVYKNQKSKLKSLIQGKYIKSEMYYNQQIHRLELLKISLSGLSMGQWLISTACVFIIAKFFIS
jgi:hypothetical protein